MPKPKNARPKYSEKFLKKWELTPEEIPIMERCWAAEIETIRTSIKRMREEVATIQNEAPAGLGRYHEEEALKALKEIKPYDSLYEESIPFLIPIAESHIADLKAKRANRDARVKIREILLARLRRKRERYRRLGPRVYMDEYGRSEIEEYARHCKMTMTMEPELVLTKEDKIEEQVKMTFVDDKGKTVSRVKFSEE